MPTTVWKGQLSFGLVSIPVKLHRAARAERVTFRQLHRGTGARVRQTYVAAEPEWSDETEEETPAPAASDRPVPATAARLAPIALPRSSVPAERPSWTPRTTPAVPPDAEVRRSDLAKGYEYAKDRFVMVTPEDLAKITPPTAREMEILEFVQLSEVDPVYFETSYYVWPDRGGERAYALLFQALNQSGNVGVARIAMHNREHIALIRPGERGLILHTMFYQDEVRRDDEYQTDTSQTGSRELDLALLLIRNLTTSFDPSKYHDTYREKLDALIQSKIDGAEIIAAPEQKAAPVINILEALQRTLETIPGGRKPPAKQGSSPARQTGRRRGK